MTRKKINFKLLGKQLVVCLVVGSAMTVLTGFYHHTVLKQHCSEDPKIDSLIDCSLEKNYKGLPWSYIVQDVPSDQTKPTVKPISFVADALVWAAVAVPFVVKSKRLVHG